MTKKLLTAILFLSLGVFLFAGCAAKESDEPEPAEPVVIPESDEGVANYAIINIRGFGEITVRLHPEYAPNTVERFVANVRSGFYTGRNFHRVISDFMIQGGSFDGQGGGDPNVEGVFTETHPDARHYYGAFCLAANQLGFGSDSFYIVNNKNTNAFVEVSEAYQREYNEMISEIDWYVETFGYDAVDARISHIMEFIHTPEDIQQKYAEVGGTPFLDGGYTVFGYTIDGFDVIDAISAVGVVNNGMGEVSRPAEEIIIEWVIVKTTLD
jgi:cyclophilin family peptidyl-prolyl cis-trans isomerase